LRKRNNIKGRPRYERQGKKENSGRRKKGRKVNEFDWGGRKTYPPAVIEPPDVEAGLLQAGRTPGPVPAHRGLRGETVGQAHQPSLPLQQAQVSHSRKGLGITITYCIVYIRMRGVQYK
jgi:hypothetical protein